MATLVRAYASAIFRHKYANAALFGVTLAELLFLLLLTQNFVLADWIYIVQHLVVLNVAFWRAPPAACDYSLAATVAVVASYIYPYTQGICLMWAPGYSAWPECGFVLVTVSAVLSFLSLISLGRLFGVRPALRGVRTTGPYRFVRHPMYLAYVIGDLGYNLEEWSFGTVLMVIVGWVSLAWRIVAEERVLSQDARYSAYTAAVHYRIFPGIW
jgi:protein-S-isoprenylcysteine O-methyltransferase Ste14